MSVESSRKDNSSGQERGRYITFRRGDVLRGFRIEEILGAGAMSVVYRATQLSLDRSVALKILPPRLARIPSFVRQFNSETASLASLNHPNIVSIIDRGHEGDFYFFAMELVEGTTLREVMRSGEVSSEFFMKIAVQSAEAIQYAHSKGIIHRDLKPANVMLNDQGNVKIADFGLAALIAEGTDQRGVMGTEGYMSPEQRDRAMPPDGRTDIYSLGAVMYELLTAELPVSLPPRPPGELREGVDPRVESMVLRCLKEDPQERYQNADELLEALVAYRDAITRMGEVCPKCKGQNPVTEKTCLHCGADLGELFDICPECGAENRRDVEVCVGCGANLHRLRDQIAVRFSKAQDEARYLADQLRYDEAIETLTELLGIKGKVFGRRRQTTRDMIEQYRLDRARHFRERVTEGRELADRGDLDEAVEVWRNIPGDLAGELGVAQLIQEAERAMQECREKCRQAIALLSRHAPDAAEPLLRSVGETWENCPGYADACRELKAERHSQEMIRFQLEQVEKHLQAHDYAAAKEAIEFARTSFPDRPRVAEKLEEIEGLERRHKLTVALQAGKEKYLAKDYAEAAHQWEEAAQLLPEQDERKAELLEKVSAARAKAATQQFDELDVVAESATAEHGAEDQKLPRTTLLIGVIALLVLIAIVAAALLLL